MVVCRIETMPDVVAGMAGGAVFIVDKMLVVASCVETTLDNVIVGFAVPLLSATVEMRTKLKFSAISMTVV